MTAKRPAAYTRAQRILKTDEFSSVFRLRPVGKSRHFVLYTRQNGLDRARLGVVAAKRLAPRAVTRNLIKRIARDVFRQSDLPALDCVIRLSGPVNAKAEPAATASVRRLVHAEIRSLLQAALQGTSR